MKKNSGILTFVVIFLIVTVVPIAGSFFSQLSDYVHITEIDYKAVVVDEPNSNGKVVITEQITFDIHSASKNYTMWELWRDLPEIPASQNDGAKVEYKVLSVKRVSTNGVADPLVFEQSDFLYWEDEDFENGPNKWFHSKGPYDGEYNFECVLIYVDGLYRETTVFEIEYEMYNASMRYNDCSELYLSVYSGSSLDYLKWLKAQILFPNSLMPSSDNFVANTFGTNSHTFDFEGSATKNAGYFTFSFQLDEQQLQFRPYNQYVEFSLVAFGADRHIFTQYASNNNLYNTNVYDTILKNQAEYFELPQRYFHAKLIVLVVLVALTVLVFVGVYFKNKSVEQNNQFFRPEVDYPIFREIPSQLDASFAGVLTMCKHSMSDDAPGGYASAILSLVKKNYIEIEKIKQNNDWSAENSKIVVVGTDANQQTSQLEVEDSPFANFNKKSDLTRVESYYYRLIRKYATSGEISMTALQDKVAEDYESTQAFVKSTKRAIKSMGMEGGYFQKLDYKKPREQARTASIFWASLGVLVLLIANIASYFTRLDLAFGAFFVLGLGLIGASIWNFVLARKYVLLTQFGENEYAKWRGLFNFLNNETLMKEHDVSQIAIWEDYLIYATAFGISEKIIRVLDVKFPDFDQTMSPILHHPYLCHYSFTHIYSRSFRTTANTAYFAGHTGIGGGYGGGGRGGGGGGGGH